MLEIRNDDAVMTLEVLQGRNFERAGLGAKFRDLDLLRRPYF